MLHRHRNSHFAASKNTRWISTPLMPTAIGTLQTGHPKRIQRAKSLKVSVFSKDPSIDSPLKVITCTCMTWVSGESAGKFYWKHHAAFECEKISDQNHESVHLQSLTAGTQVGCCSFPKSEWHNISTCYLKMKPVKDTRHGPTPSCVFKIIFPPMPRLHFH